MIKDHPIFEYSQITDQIFLGTNMCCSMHGEGLFNLGLDADIDLEEERTGVPPKVSVYLWLPVKDLQAPTQIQLEVGVATIDKSVKGNKKIYIHCRNGHGRSPTLVAAYFISQGGSIEEALKKIKQKRPEIHLEETQLQALKTFQQKRASS